MRPLAGFFPASARTVFTACLFFIISNSASFASALPPHRRLDGSSDGSGHRSTDEPRRAERTRAVSNNSLVAGCCVSFNNTTNRYQYYSRPANLACAVGTVACRGPASVKRPLGPQALPLLVNPSLASDKSVSHTPQGAPSPPPPPPDPSPPPPNGFQPVQPPLVSAEAGWDKKTGARINPHSGRPEVVPNASVLNAARVYAVSNKAGCKSESRYSRRTVGLPIKGGSELLFQLPSCKAASPFGGYARQRCVADSLLARAEASMVKGDLAKSDLVSAALCAADQLTRREYVDSCHMISHKLGHLLWLELSELEQSEANSPVNSANLSKLPPPQGEGPDMSWLLRVIARGDIVCGDACLYGCRHAMILAGVNAIMEAKPPSPSDAPWSRDILLSTLFTFITHLMSQEILLSGFRGEIFHYMTKHFLGHAIALLLAEGLIKNDESFDLCDVTGNPTSACRGGFLAQFAAMNAQENAKRWPSAADWRTGMNRTTWVSGFHTHPQVNIGRAVGMEIATASCNDPSTCYAACPDSELQLYEDCLVGCDAESGQLFIDRQRYMAPCPREATLFLIGVQSCNTSAENTTTSHWCCGDGLCEWTEDASSCPSDCTTTNEDRIKP